MKRQSKNLPVVIEPTTKEELEKVLTDKQQMFCLEYVKDFNGSASYLRAGYKTSEKTARINASQLLTNTNLQKYIEILKNERTERTEIDLDWVIKNITEVITRCMQHTQVFDREGNPVMAQTPNGQLAAAYIFDSRGALKGLELLGQHVGLKKVDEDSNRQGGIEITLNNYLGQPNNTYFPVTPETEHLAKLLGVGTETVKEKNK